MNLLNTVQKVNRMGWFGSLVWENIKTQNLSTFSIMNSFHTIKLSQTKRSWGLSVTAVFNLAAQPLCIFLNKNLEIHTENM
jgi:hypothetical protein